VLFSVLVAVAVVQGFHGRVVPDLGATEKSSPARRDHDQSERRIVPDLGAIEKSAQLLISPVQAEREDGQQWLQRHGDEAFDALIVALRSEDPKEQQRASRVLRIMVSPWARGVEAGAVHHGQTHLYKPWRPVTRPTDHPQAGRIRLAAMSVLRTVLEKPRGTPQESGKNWEFPGWETLNSITALCRCLSEVGDEETGRQLSELLEKEKNRYIASSLLECQETIYGLPPSYRPGGLCGNSTQEEVKAFNEADQAHCAEAIRKRLAWLSTEGRKQGTARIEAAVKQWEIGFRKGENMFQHGVLNWSSQDLASLIRLGDAVVPLIEQRKETTEELWLKANYDVVLAAITGKVDKRLVETLLDRDYHSQIIACEIIAAADSKEWMPELTQMLKVYYASKKAAYTLAVVHRREAIPILRPYVGSENYMADCAVKELESWKE